MKYFFTLLMAGLLLVACNSTDKTTESPAKAAADSVTAAENDTAVAATDTLGQLKGNWQLNYITGPRIAFDGLYPDKKPELRFDIPGARVSGNTGCNSLSGPVNISGNTLSFGALVTTEMACKGNGEKTFLSTLKKINRYDITDGNTLHLLMDDMAMMRFTRMP